MWVRRDIGNTQADIKNKGGFWCEKDRLEDVPCWAFLYCFQRLEEKELASLPHLPWGLATGFLTCWKDYLKTQIKIASQKHSPPQSTYPLSPVKWLLSWSKVSLTGKRLPESQSWCKKYEFTKMRWYIWYKVKWLVLEWLKQNTLTFFHSGRCFPLCCRLKVTKNKDF